MRTYEVICYSDSDDFEFSRGKIPIIDGITNKRVARKEGRLWLAEFPIVKVQSSDREFIEILRKGAAE